MAGLQHHGDGHADGREQQCACQPARLHAGHVQVTETGEAVLDLVDTEEDEGNAQHDAPCRLAPGAEETGQHAEDQQRQRQGTEAEVLPGQRQQPDAAGGAQVGAEQDGDAAGQLDQPGADEGDGEQRHQGAGLQQQRATDAEQQALEGRRGTAREDLLQLAAGQLAQALLQALHAEQEHRQAGAQLQPTLAEPERGDQPHDQQTQHHPAQVLHRHRSILLAVYKRKRPLASKPRRGAVYRSLQRISPACSHCWCSRGSVRTPLCPARPPGIVRLHRRCRPVR